MKADYPQFARYLVNGMIATMIHFLALRMNIDIIGIKSAGIANFIAAVFGLSASFLGARYFVFTASRGSAGAQILKFASLYGLIAFLHGAILWAWTDRYGLDYRVGFIIATGFQLMLSYFGNKKLVFQK